jgi:hypothetical protein
MEIRSPNSKRKVESSDTTMGVYYEQHRIGHVLMRSDQRFEAYDRTARSLGIFETEDDAAIAIWKAAHGVTAERNNVPTFRIVDATHVELQIVGPTKTEGWSNIMGAPRLVQRTLKRWRASR